MHIVGFGCSFTYGSELSAPGHDSWDQHHTNDQYRQRWVYLGQLAHHYGATVNNLSQPSGSNTFIWHELAQYIMRNPEPDHNELIVIGWTNIDRMSWYHDDEMRWVHSGYIRFNNNPHPSDACFSDSCKEWIKHSLNYQINHDIHIRMSANALLETYGVPYVQFNALDHLKGYERRGTGHRLHTGPQGKNCFMGNQNMHDWLREQHGDAVFAGGEHPNERGHELWIQQLIPYLDTKVLMR